MGSSSETSLNLQEFITEICLHDIRTASGVDQIKITFKENSQLFISNEYLDIIQKFFDVQECLTNFVVFCERYFVKSELDKDVFDKYCQVLTLITSEFYSEYCDDYALSIQLPECSCEKRSSLYHKKSCDDTAHERNSLIIKKVLSYCSVFQEVSDVINDVNNMLVGNAILNSKESLKQLSNSASNFYDCLVGFTDNNAQVKLPQDEYINYRNCIIELLSWNDLTSLEDLAKIKAFVKSNLSKLVLSDYVRLMHKLNLVGWYGTQGVHNELMEIAIKEKFLTNSIKELPAFEHIVAEIRVRFVGDEAERNETLSLLKKISKYILLFDYARLIRIINDEIVEYKMSHVKFYNTFNYIVLQTVTNCFKG